MELNYNKELKVLVVEDDSQRCESLKKTILKVSQHILKFCFVDTVLDALEILDTNKFDVIILNLSFSDDKIIIVLEELNKKYSHIALVFIIEIYGDNFRLNDITNSAYEYLIKDKCDGQGLIETVNFAFEKKCAEKVLNEINGCLLNLGCNQNDNLSKIVKTAGTFLKGNFAFYCKEDGLSLCMKGFWNIPKEFKRKAGKVYCINYKVIAGSKDEPLVINNFDTIFCAKVDANISKYKIKTYVGCAVKIDSKVIGALCVFCDKNKILTRNEVKILLILAKTIGLEEQRKKSEENKSETKKKYQMLMDNIRDAIFMTDTKFSAFLDANEKAEALIEENSEKLSDMRYFQLYPKDKIDYSRDKFEKQIHKRGHLDV